MTKKPKLISSIRAKLVSAVAMLLVAMIMVVSSTYAWFTLSTAPEVTGISTQIGANGALEMALWTGVDPQTGVVSSTDNTVRNTYWGNLVDLSTGYGLDKITLYPSQLNVDENGVISGFPVSIPEYGADGRVNKLDDKATLTGLFDGTHFYEGANAAGQTFGVRGVGAASGMTDRQLAYRDAKGQGSDFTNSAKSKASTALNTNGSALANIAIEYGMGADTASFDKTDVDALRALIDGTTEALADIEKAYMHYIAAFATSAVGPTDDTKAMAVYSTVNTAGKTLADIEDILTENGVTLTTEVSNAIAKLRASQASVAAADTELDKLEDVLKTDSTATFGWTTTTGENAKLGISGAMTPMASTSAMKINGFTAGEVKENLGAIVSSITDKGGLFVTMETGAGVFADIADHCGDYTASVVIKKVEYNGIVLNNMKARMATETGVDPQYLPAIGLAVDGKAPTGDGAKMPFSEFYGYIIDMVFQTNAAESNLLLQTDAIDRIYKDKAENNDQKDEDNTWGHGSTMAFGTDDSSFGNDMIQALMGNLRVVFFDPTKGGAGNLGTVLAYAKLDMSKAFINEESKTEAPLVLYKTVEAFSYTDTDGKTAICFAKTTTTTTGEGDDATTTTTTTYYSDYACTTVVDVTGLTLTATKVDVTLSGTDAIITAMTQNAAVNVSALVYLDGTTMTNEHVSATAQKSLTGTMNLQFASSATLVPMEYADLHPQSSTTNP